jgi:hypothetical protein
MVIFFAIQAKELRLSDLIGREPHLALLKNGAINNRLIELDKSSEKLVVIYPKPGKQSCITCKQSPTSKLPILSHTQGKITYNKSAETT